MPPRVQQSYRAQIRSQSLDDHLELIHDQLRKDLKANTGISAGMKIGRNSAITSLKTRYIYQDSLEFEAGGETITITNSALCDYFTEYGLDLAPLTQEDIDFLKEQYAGNGEGDLTFKMGPGGIVKRIHLKKVPKGGNRWDMQQDHTGIALGNEASNLLSVFDFVPLRY